MSSISYSQLTLYQMVMCMVCFQRYSIVCFLSFFKVARERIFISYCIRTCNFDKCYSTELGFYYEIRRSTQKWAIFINNCATFSFKTVINSFLTWGSVEIPWPVANVPNWSLFIINWVRLFTFSFTFFSEFSFECRLYENLMLLFFPSFAWTTHQKRTVIWWLLL